MSVLRLAKDRGVPWLRTGHRLLLIEVCIVTASGTRVDHRLVAAKLHNPRVYWLGSVRLGLPKMLIPESQNNLCPILLESP